MRISDWSSDVCSSDLRARAFSSSWSRKPSCRAPPTIPAARHDQRHIARAHQEAERIERIAPRNAARGQDHMDIVDRDQPRALFGQQVDDLQIGGFVRVRADRPALFPEQGEVDLERGRTRGNDRAQHGRSEEHKSELQSLMRISYAVFCLKKKTTK